MAKDRLKELEMRRNGSAKTKNSKDKENKPLRTEQNAIAEDISANIDKLVQFIEGGPQNDFADKKAQKKARQKQKKEEERRRREEEEEAARKAEEERILIEEARAERERIREELALQKSLRKKMKQQAAEKQSSGKKKKGKEQNNAQKEEESRVSEEPELFEQTIPAMVTIKRIVENNNSPPTVTITLKGSTPDQDQLLYTLVNGHDAPIIAPPSKDAKDKSSKQVKNEKQTGKTNDNQSNQKSGKKKNGNNNVTKVESTNSSRKNVQTSEIKVQLAIDKSFRKDVAKLKETKEKESIKDNASTQGKKKQQQQQQQQKDVKVTKVTKQEVKQNTTQTKVAPPPRNDEVDRDIIDIPSLKLPPGITITKVSGPVATRKSTTTQNDYTDVPVSKLGVIVVDTEKLIQQQNGKKKKKKNKKNAVSSETPPPVQPLPKTSTRPNEPRVHVKPSTSYINTDPSSSSSSSSGMVTLKNPIFHTLQNKMMHPSDAVPPHMLNMSEQATISRGENGMVTIRRSRPVGFYTPNESPISEYLSAQAQAQSAVASGTKTSTASRREPIMTPWQMPDTSISALTSDRKIIRPPSPRTAQWPRTEAEGKLSAPSVLQGLPGIEITRVKNATSPAGGRSLASDGEYVEPPADVSVIRTGGADKTQNWTYGKPSS